MKPIRKILLPVEFTPACARARDHAVALAERHQAELHFLHVQILYGGNYAMAGLANIATLEKEIATSNTEKLNTFVAGLQVPVVTAIERDSSASAGILRYAEDQAIDLIVLGTHARKTIPRLFMGSIATEVVRHSPIPLLTVGPRGGQTPGSYRRILVPQDFSAPAWEALLQAGIIAKQHGARLSVLHVINPNLLPPYFGFAFGDAEHKRAYSQLEQRVKEAELAVPAEIIVSVGVPDKRIADYAIDHSVDLVIMGKTGQNVIENLLIGSTTERVLRRAPCPIWVHTGPEAVEG